MQQVNEHIDGYRYVQEQLDTIDGVETEIQELFATELEVVADIQRMVDEKRQAILMKRGITEKASDLKKKHTSLRSNLYTLLRDLPEDQKEFTITNSTYTRDDVSIQRVDKQPTLVRVDDTLDTHKKDVALLLENEMYTSLQIVTDNDMVQWMLLRKKNDLPTLTSFAITPTGYCKVKLS